MPVVESFTENMRAWKDCYRSTGNARECNLEEQFQPYPGDIGPIKLQEKLARLEELNPSYR
ncbi:MAG: hypothetical protein U5L96_15065 [Owenweeksia sp.]|nr:hypothetical protein [Owenweeksia sp.]